MNAVSPHADKLVLLASSDWFLPYWKHIGLDVDPAQAPAFQERMRRAAREMIGQSETYWEIDFSDQRLGRTRQRWLDALKATAGSFDFTLLEGSSQERKAARSRCEDWYDLDGVATADTEWDRWLCSLTPDLPEFLKDFALSPE